MELIFNMFGPLGILTVIVIVTRLLIDKIRYII